MTSGVALSVNGIAQQHQVRLGRACGQEHMGFTLARERVKMRGCGHRCPGSLWVIKERPRLVPSPSGLALYEARQQSRSNAWDAWG